MTMHLADGTYSAADAAAAMGGRVVAGPADRRLGAVSIDSRSLAAGDLFFAIVAGRDGHDFVPAAFDRTTLTRADAEQRFGMLAQRLGDRKAQPVNVVLLKARPKLWQAR